MFSWYIDGIKVAYDAPATQGGVSPVAGTVPTPRRTTLQTDNNGFSERPAHHARSDPYRQGEAQDKPRAPAVTVAQILSSPVRVLRANEPLSTVQQFFSEHHYRHAPVVDDSGKLCGVVSDRDLLRVVATGLPSGTPLSAWMKSKVLTAHPTTEIRFAARLMLEQNIGCLPVVDDQDTVTGMVTRSDILRAVVGTVPLELWI